MKKEEFLNSNTGVFSQRSDWEKGEGDNLYVIQLWQIVTEPTNKYKHSCLITQSCTKCD